MTSAMSTVLTTPGWLRKFCTLLAMRIPATTRLTATHASHAALYRGRWSLLPT